MNVEKCRIIKQKNVEECRMIKQFQSNKFEEEIKEKIKEK